MKSVKAKSERDKHVVEAVVRGFGPLSRAKIHELTQIRPSATSQIVRELLKEGRLLEAGVDGGHLGRKGVLLKLNEQYQHLVGLEFDDEEVVAGVTDLHPRITHLCREQTVLADGVEGLVRQLVGLARKALQEANLAAESLIGIGIADPGLVDSRRGITRTSSTIGFWRDVPLKAIFEREFGVPALVETRTRAKTVAERRECTDGRGDSMVYVDYGTGIGAGISVDGRMLLGYGSAAGEFGHTRVVDEGPACNCGSFGCLEAIAGMRAVEARVRRAIADGGNTEVLEMAGGDVSLGDGRRDGGHREPTGARGGSAPARTWPLSACRRAAQCPPQPGGSRQTAAQGRDLPGFGAGLSWSDRSDPENHLDCHW